MARSAKNTRMCVGCRLKTDKSNLLHISAKKDGSVSLDGLGKSVEGRGAYLCPNLKCLETAIKRKSMSRNLRCEIPQSLTEEIESFVKSLNAE